MSKRSIVALIFIAILVSFYISTRYSTFLFGPEVGHTPQSSPAQCECYVSSDCQVGQSCNYASGCQSVSNKNGMCRARNRNADWRRIEIPAVTATVDAWFSAYITVAEQGGTPDVTAIKAMKLPSLWHVETAHAVFNAMDRLLGSDFGKPGSCSAFNTAIFTCPPAMPRLDAPALSLVSSVGIAFSEAVRTGNPKLIEKPINAFWKKYPTFKPARGGRCYASGNADAPKGNERICQINELEQILIAFLAGRE